MNTPKDVKYYLSLPYTFEVIREDDTTWFARVRELPGCMTEGDSPEDAMVMLQDAMTAWLEVSLEIGYSIPEPSPEPDYSGKFNLRVPKSLHRDLAEAALREGVSLNQYILAELARAVGRTEATSQPAVKETAGAEARSSRKSKPSAGSGRAVSVLHERPDSDAAYGTST